MVSLEMRRAARAAAYAAALGLAVTACTHPAAPIFAQPPTLTGAVLVKTEGSSTQCRIDMSYDGLNANVGNGGFRIDHVLGNAEGGPACPLGAIVVKGELTDTNLQRFQSLRADWGALLQTASNDLRKFPKLTGPKHGTNPHPVATVLAAYQNIAFIGNTDPAHPATQTFFDGKDGRDYGPQLCGVGSSTPADRAGTSFGPTTLYEIGTATYDGTSYPIGVVANGSSTPPRCAAGAIVLVGATNIG